MRDGKGLVRALILFILSCTVLPLAWGGVFLARILGWYDPSFPPTSVIVGVIAIPFLLLLLIAILAFRGALKNPPRGVMVLSAVTVALCCAQMLVLFCAAPGVGR
ncbi:MAG TPA: hypothetical protein VHQ47_14990 [Phycisphaerae bacterium]|nr:hypothetical protein [Phycisphaerae bacterium]